MASEEGGRAEKGGRVVGGMFLSDDEISAFREVFSLVDKDGSGEIDAEEVSELMELLGMSADKSTVETMIKEIDADGNGNVDFDEFFDLATRSAQFVDADATRE